MESHLLLAARLRDQMQLVVGTNVGYRISELLTPTLIEVLTPVGEVAPEVSLAAQRR